MVQKLSITDLAIKGKKVLMRVDFNVPLDQDGEIVDDTRIEAALHSIRYVVEQGGALILMSHLGRPHGRPTPELSLAPCSHLLSKMLGQPVIQAPDCIGPEVRRLAAALQPGQVLLLENLRFHPGEEAADAHFARELAALADLYVNDAFGTAHRNHASTVTITAAFDGCAAAGFLLEKELRFLGDALAEPQRPFWAVVGGAKVSGKIELIKSLIDKVDGLLVAGGMAYTFFKAMGREIGDSLLEEEQLPLAQSIIDQCASSDVALLLPIDHILADRISASAASRLQSTSEEVMPGEIGVDIGPETVALFIDKLSQAKTIFWNGPLGAFEVSLFAQGTKAIAREMAHLEATTIVGGGDSAAALHAVGVADQITHISTGGGAALKYIEQGSLPAIEVLTALEEGIF